MKDILKKIEIFKTLDEKELDLISECFEIVEAKKGEFLFKTNYKRQYFYVVKEGIVELLMITPPDREVLITTFSKFDFFGEGGLLDDYPHSNNARIKKDAVLFRLSKSSFDLMFETQPKLVSKILAQISRVISRRLRKATSDASGTAAQYISGKTRLEHDLLGDREVPEEAYFGIQTLRAKENFPITGVTINLYTDLIVALTQIKKAAIKANHEIGLIPDDIYKAVNKACDEIINRKYHIHFIVDVIQGGAGTSTNMNANEVIANRALEIMGYEKGQYEYCHPNNHINLSQSTNDIYPNAIKIACYYKTVKLLSALRNLVDSFRAKAKEFSDVIKMGRTQLQDAVPMTLGQEFEAYAYTLEEEIYRVEHNVDLLLELNIGGTAIGTGLNASHEYREAVIKHLSKITGIKLRKSENYIEATQDTGAFVIFASVLKRLAVKLSKICNDLRLLSSGPRAGLNEINLPKMQPGSSIMPGKVNPVIPEVVNQVAFNCIGKELTITIASEAGQLELNVMEPIIAVSLFEMMDSLKNSMIVLKSKCIDGITANREVCRKMVENSITLVTALNPILGYELSSSVAKEALESNRSITSIVLERKLMSKKQLDELLTPENLIGKI